MEVYPKAMEPGRQQMSTSYSPAQLAAARLTSSGLFVRLMTVYLVCNDMLGGLVYSITGSSLLGTLFLYSKYVLFSLIFLVFSASLATGKIRLVRTDIYAGCYFVWAALFTIGAQFGDSSFKRVAYGYIFPVIIYCCGRLFPKRDLAPYLSFLVRLLMILMLFGLVDYFFLGESLWKDVVHYGDYVSNVKGLNDTTMDGLPGNLYYDPYGAKVRRLVSTFGDPLAFAYFAFAVVCVYWFSLRHTTPRRGFAVLAAVTLALSLTRAILLTIPLLLITRRVFQRYTFFILIGIGILAAVLSQIYLSADALGDSSSAGHLASLRDFSNNVTLESLMFGTLLSDQDMLFEMGYMDILVNLGLVGVLLFTAFIASIFQNTYRTMNGIAMTFAGGALTLLIFSQSFLSTSSSWIAWFLAGWAVTQPIAQGVKVRVPVVYKASTSGT